MPEVTLSGELLLLVVILVLGLTFDFINGFHDTANAIATVVATRVLSPGRAVLMAGGQVQPLVTSRESAHVA